MGRVEQIEGMVRVLGKSKKINLCNVPIKQIILKYIYVVL